MCFQKLSEKIWTFNLSWLWLWHTILILFSSNYILLIFPILPVARPASWLFRKCPMLPFFTVHLLCVGTAANSAAFSFRVLPGNPSIMGEQRIWWDFMTWPLGAAVAPLHHVCKPPSSGCHQCFTCEALLAVLWPCPGFADTKELLMNVHKFRLVWLRQPPSENALRSFWPHSGPSVFPLPS